ncbi:MAG: DNA-directed RNA polymerase subunit omega [Paludibacteraceae bacterium]|nr:DNA-directed RNA polymerase subunit omega [Paludibacteraceae bacterium]
MDYKNSKAPHNTVTRDMNELSQKVGNVYETVAIISKRANQISQELKKELDAKLQDFNVPQENIDEVFENKEQIEISRQYEVLPKPSLLATEEFLEDELTIRNTSKDKALEE